MAGAGRSRLVLAPLLILLCAPVGAQRETPRSLLVDQEASLLASWHAEGHPDELASYAQIEGFALRERRRRSEILREALLGRFGESALRRAQELRALEIALSEHAIVDPYQYILDFRDSSNRVEVPGHAALDLREAYTVSLWLFLEGGARAWETKLYSHSDVNDNKFNVMLEGRRLELLLWDASDQPMHFRSSDELPLRRWMHLVIAYEAGRGPSCHVDGVPIALRQSRGDDEFPPLRRDPTQELYLGCLDRCIPGSLDDVRVYDRRLDHAEIVSLGQGAQLCEGLVAHWPLDELRGVDAANLIRPELAGRVGEGVRRGVPGPQQLGGGTAFGFSGKAERWSVRLHELEQQIDAVELELLALCGQPAPASSALGRFAQPLVVYLPDRPVAYLCTDRVQRIELPAVELPEWRAELGQRARGRDDAEWRAIARRLAIALWDPVARELAAAREVWLSLPPELSALPFSALVDAEGRYLQESIAFARVGPLLRIRAEPIVAAGEAILIGNPDFRAPRGRNNEAPWKRGEASGGGDRDGRCWVSGPLLYGSHLELERLCALFAPREHSRLEWYDAYLTVLEQEMPRAGIIHLATHGYRIDRDCVPELPRERLEWSGLKLGGSDVLRGDDLEHEDRGYLSAAGLARLDLRATRLIFFSGCETASDAGASLAEAAWLAGAWSSVGTLAAIDDGLTPVLAERFHAQWLAGESPAEALRQAREALRAHLLATRGRAHPSAWAPFVLTGL